jgi:homoserine/homoserine lactone efflux protein
MSSQSLLAYFVTWFLVALTPGPAVICVMSQAARYGWQAGFRGVLGIQLGNLLFFLCIASGLLALLSTTAHAFFIVQFAGAVYLLYLGLRIIISSLRASADAFQGFGLGAERRNLVAQALFVQLTNPKALLFVSALLPQFLDSHRPMASQLAILLSCTVVIDTAVLGSYALLAHRGMRAIRHSQVSRWIECTFGAALILLGIRLVEWRK